MAKWEKKRRKTKAQIPITQFYNLFAPQNACVRLEIAIESENPNGIFARRSGTRTMLINENVVICPMDECVYA